MAAICFPPPRELRRRVLSSRCLTFKMAQAEWQVTRGVLKGWEISVRRPGATKAWKERTSSRRYHSYVKYLKSYPTKGACLFCGLQRAMENEWGSCREVDVSISVHLCLIMNIGPATDETRPKSKGALDLGGSQTTVSRIPQHHKLWAPHSWFKWQLAA